MGTTPILGITEMSSGQANKYVTFNEAMALIDAQALYLIGMTYVGQPTASEVIMRHPACVTFNLPSGIPNSQFKAGVAATAQTTFTMKKNGGAIGTLVFALGATSATINFTPAVAFAVGDVLTIEAPGSPDATLADLGFTIKGTR